MANLITTTAEEIIDFARSHSPFYKDLYSHLPPDPTLQDLPVLPQDKFWEANNPRNNKLLTTPFDDGVVFKSGGTTGNPKYSWFTHMEWKTFTKTFGAGISGNLRGGERVANLFYSGDLYASFFIHQRFPRLHVHTLRGSPLERLRALGKRGILL